MQHNYRNRYLVVIDGDVYVYKYEKCKFAQPFLSFKQKHVSIGKTKVCDMTDFSGAANNSSDFDGNTSFLEVEDSRYVYISGLEITEFETSDKVIDCISLMSNNMVPYAIILGEKYTNFLYHRYKMIENDKIEEGTLLNATNTSLDPYDLHVEICDFDAFKKLENELIHTSWPGHRDGDGEVEDDSNVDVVEEIEEFIEKIYTNGNNEMVKMFSQKCVISLERDSDYAFRQCGHQCICEQCYQIRGDIDILKGVVCRT